MNKRHKHSSIRSNQQPFYFFRHKIAVFIVYLIIFASITAWVDYYAYEIYNPLLFVLISLVSAFIATYLHTIRSGRREDKVDKLADKL